MLDVLIEPLYLLLHGALLRRRACQQTIPDIAHHIVRHRQQRWRRLQFAEQRSELAFDLIARDRFAVMVAALGRAEIIGIGAAAPLRPAALIGLAAAVAGDEAAQRKVKVDVLARWHLGVALQAALDGLERREADERFMPCGLQRDAPGGIVDISGVDRPRQQVIDMLRREAAVGAVLPFIMSEDETAHFRLGLKALRRIAFKCLGDDRSIRLVPHQQFAVPVYLLIAITDRRLKAPIAVHGPRPHAVLDLLSIFAAVMLCDGGENILAHLAVGIVAEFQRWRFENAARYVDRRAQLHMRPYGPRQARDVVDDDDKRLAPVLFQHFQHGPHRRTLGGCAGKIVMEGGDDVVAARGSVFAAAGFLAFKAVAFDLLFLAGDAAIDHRFAFCNLAHGSVFPAAYPAAASLKVEGM